MKLNNLNDFLMNVSNNLNKNLHNDECSILVTGSVARGDLNLTIDLDILSDIDILIIINNVKNIRNLGVKLKRIFKNIKNKYNVSCSLIFTKKDFFIKNDYAYYVLNTNENFILYDELSIKKCIIKRRYYNILNNIENKLPFIFQTISYYQARYNFFSDSRTYIKLNKAVLELLLIVNNIDCKINSFNDLYKYNDVFIGKYNINIYDVYTKHICNKFGVNVNLINILNINLNKKYYLKSTVYFYENINIDKKQLYYNVRNEVFMENQGLSYETSLCEI